MGKKLFEKQVSRCNKSLLIFNIFLSILLFGIISLFLQKFPVASIIFSLFLLIPIYYFYRLYERFYDFRNHPLYIRFLRFEYPLQIEELIENELNNKVIFTGVGNIITEHWIVNESLLDFFAINYTEIIWVYIKETKHSVNFIPTETTYGIQIHSMLRNTQNKMMVGFEFGNSKENALNCFILIQKFAPWAVYGFNDQLQNLWANKPDSMVQKVTISNKQERPQFDYTRHETKRDNMPKKSEQDNRKLSELWYNKGVTFTKSNEYEKALAAYDQALAYNNKDPDIWNNECYILIKLGKYDEAVMCGKVAVHLSPQDPEIWDTLSNAYSADNDREKADECQKNVLQLKKIINTDKSKEKTPHNSDTVTSGFRDIFDFFSGGQQRSCSQPGADLLKCIQIRAEDAIVGMDREIELMHTEQCTTCNGSGNESKLPNICLRCGGTGQMRQAAHSAFGQFVRMTTCTQCGGKGIIPGKICNDCLGLGLNHVKRKVSIHIPAGIENGMRLRMEGWGESGKCGGKNGDLFIEVHIK